MANYTEIAKTKMDWAMPFQRTSAYPLDRSSIFTSLADATKYAAGNTADPDSRGLCGSSYIGQIVAVSENNTVEVYKITSNRTLQVLGAVTGVDNASIELNGTVLRLKGFNTATEGQVPYIAKDDGNNLYLAWRTPSDVDIDELQEQVDGLDAILNGTGEGQEHVKGLVENFADLDADVYRKSQVYTKTEVDGKLTGALHYKGTKSTFQDLLDDVTAGTYTPATGDVWNITTAGGTDAHGTAIKAGDNVIYNGTGWDDSTGLTDLSNYYTKTQTDTLLGGKVDKVTGSSLVPDGEITRLAGLEAISDPTASDGRITLTDKDGNTREVVIYTLPTATSTVLGGVKSSSTQDQVSVGNDGVMTVNNISASKVQGSVASAAKVDHKITIGSKEFDGSNDVTILAADIPLPSNIAKTDVYATDAVGGTVKSSSAQDKVSVGVDGIMTVNNISASKVQGVVSEAAKVSNSLTIGEKTFDGSEAVEITAEDLPIPTNVVQFTDIATASKTGVVKSSSANDQVAVGNDGTMTINGVSPSKLTGAALDSNKLGGVMATDILTANGSGENQPKVKAAAKADALATAINLTFTGDATGSANGVDGSSNVSVALTLADVLTPAAGTYTKVTVNKKGQVTNAENLTASDIPSLTMDKISNAGALATLNAVEEENFGSTLASTFSSLKTNEHTHTNKAVLDGIGETQINLWNTVSNKADAATTLDGYGILDAYTKTEVDGKISGAFHYKGTYATYQALLDGDIDPDTGDVYNITTAGGTDSKGTAVKAGDNVAAVVTTSGDPAVKTVEWDVLGGTTDLSAYATNTWVTSNFAGLTAFNTLNEIVVGSDGQGGLKAVVGDASSGLVKDVNALKTTVGDNTASPISKLPLVMQIVVW